MSKKTECIKHRIEWIFYGSSPTLPNIQGWCSRCGAILLGRSNGEVWRLPEHDAEVIENDEK